MEKMPLVGLTEIAQAAGVQKPVVAMWRVRHDDFPEPVADLRTGPVFWWPEVETWLSVDRAAHRPGLDPGPGQRFASPGTKTGDARPR